MTGSDDLKRAAAAAAVALVEDSMHLGLGTGSTAEQVLHALAERRAAGELPGIRGMATSRATLRLARQLEIPLFEMDDAPHLDLVLDGADEVDPHLDLIKGLGGALLWEKMVAASADRLVVVVDDSKLVERLGTRAPLPVEVVPFMWRSQLAFLELLGAKPKLRTDPEGAPMHTDSGHYLIDCRFADGMHEPERIERELRQRPGIVESGLFLQMADSVIVAGREGVRILHRQGNGP